ncbi:hypothetical protein Ae331Ps2_6040c [Pseudonocardia sp. Ae331_Ps2]|nr:hypothetical protein Ae331Ps2_6035c [Pseudonocardia sp. Ae331_Ps2]OLL89705.1 hypothetical protein Ae331Ps2_6040c [Pseudonocardia sp. Ae331_Ps2]
MPTFTQPGCSPGGRAFQLIPVLSTKTIPARAARSGTHLRCLNSKVTTRAYGGHGLPLSRARIRSLRASASSARRVRASSRLGVSRPAVAGAAAPSAGARGAGVAVLECSRFL